MKETTDQIIQALRQAIDWALGIIQLVWTWSSDQILKLTQTPWDSWPLWKQILLVAVAALVAYPLFIAARQLWRAALSLFYAVAYFLVALIVTLPAILVAGAIALGGLWVINNLQNVPSLRPFLTVHSITTPRTG